MGQDRSRHDAKDGNIIDAELSYISLYNCHSAESLLEHIVNSLDKNDNYALLKG